MLGFEKKWLKGGQRSRTDKNCFKCCSGKESKSPAEKSSGFLLLLLIMHEF